LNKITGERNRVKGAGRTDAGVHARGQVAAFTTRSRHDASTFMTALNHYLPEDISVRGACEAPRGFDPRRRASSRRYRYVIANRRSRPALDRARALWVRESLDTAVMDAEAQALVGRHDFASFSGSLAGTDRSTVREVKGARIAVDGCAVSFDIEATAFLPQQVRRTVGILLAVGRGAERPGRVRFLLDHPALGAAGQVAAPHGLYLLSVTYPEGTLNFEDV